MTAKWTPQLEKLIAYYTEHEAFHVQKMMRHRDVLREKEPKMRDIEAMLNMLTKVFSESSRGADGYRTICGKMGLEYSLDPEKYYANIDAMVALAEENGSGVGAGLRTTTGMARAMLREIGRVLGPKAS